MGNPENELDEKHDLIDYTNCAEYDLESGMGILPMSFTGRKPVPRLSPDTISYEYDYEHEHEEFYIA